MALRTPNFDGGGGDSEINISPLIDVIFILLIFFVVTMSFSDNSAMKVDKPSSTQAESTDRLPVNICIDKDGNISVDGKAASMDSIETMLSARAGAGDFDVMIEADANAPVQTLVDVMDCAKAGGAKRTYIAARKIQ